MKYFVVLITIILGISCVIASLFALFSIKTRYIFIQYNANLECDKYKNTTLLLNNY